MKFCRSTLAILFLSFVNVAVAFVQPGQPPLPGFDKRAGAAFGHEGVSQEQRRAVAQLHARQPRAQVEFDPITGGPRAVGSGSEFLSGSNGLGGAIPAPTASRFAIDDPYRATKAFLLEYRDLFRHGPELLDQARLSQQYVTPHNGLRTAVWQQEVDGIPVFEAVLISHTSRRGELLNISGRLLTDLTGAVERGGQNRADLGASLKVSGRRAVATAAGQIDERLSEEQVESTDGVTNPPVSIPDLAKRQAFRASALKGDAEAKLVWLPMNGSQLRLCWDVILTGRTRGEMYRVLVDVRTGEPLLRRCLTEYVTDATYRVYTSDSPSPFSPGHSTPATNQPPLVSRSLLTISALDTNASPSGWINDGVNETRGNNVDAHTDLNSDDQADSPRPQGSPFRVFDFPLDLSNDPSTYRSAAVVQLFYWCNWMHDQLYGLGFTEAAGNFQNDNFGRGGFGNDALLADAQDGGGFNNANFSSPPDGSPPRMQMYLWSNPTPNRDGDLDAEIILHEYTHGLSNRRVGGGQALYTPQSGGLGEGWSDFYALALLSEPGDDVDGVYAVSTYSMYRFGGLTQNYYFGIRRYPYCTDLHKSPLTLKDIDPTQASSHAGIPRNPVIGTAAGEVHNMGELWCVALWDARASLIRKYGATAGNRLMLQLVTDGMTLTPPLPNFLQGRDAILQADLVNSGGANQIELWNAFAKRGMGRNAVCPASGTSIGVQESFDVPDDMQISPASAATFLSLCGQPIFPSCQVYQLGNVGSNVLTWTARATEPWVSVDPTSGSLAPGTSSNITVCLTPSATTLPAGENAAGIVFSNTVTTATDTRPVVFRLTLPALCFPLDNQPAWALEGEWAFGRPAGLGGAQFGNPDPASGASGTNVFGINLNGDYSVAVGGPYYLTAGPLNFSGYTGMTLQFQRWLNTDFQPYAYATIEVSADGTNWSPVWDNGTTQIADEAWTQVAYDISAISDNQTNVFVRWGHWVVSPLAFPCSGWNIDDVEFVGTPSQEFAQAPPVPSNPLPANLAINVDKTTGLEWQEVSFPFGTITNDVYFGTNPTLGPGEFLGSTTNQNWTLPLLAPQTTYYWQIIARRIGVTPGPIWQFTTRGVDHFTWNSIQSPQFVNKPFPVVVIARDVTGSVVSNFTGTVSLRSVGGALSPTNSGLFANGAWQGSVMTTQPAANISLVADDGAGHTGSSGLFDAVLTNDISITLSADSDPVPAGTLLTYTLTVANSGAANATDVTVTNILPLNVSLISVLPSQGVWQATNGVVTVSLGSIPGGTNATTTVRVLPTTTIGDTLTNIAEVSRAEVELYLDNNTAILGTKVGPPEVSIADAAIKQGNFGTTNMLFPVTLSAPSPGTVWVNYSTTNGSALAGQDYVATNGVVALPPGTTNTFASVTVIAHPLIQSNRFFLVNLSEPTNAVLGRRQAVGTLIQAVASNTPATVVLQPANQVAAVGDTASFFVIANGTPPLSYQWSFDGTNVLGATNISLVIANAQLSDSGSYAVVVSNAFGGQQSSNATLRVGVPPAITAQPTNQTVRLGASVAFDVVAEGTAPLAYQWSHGGTNLINATNSMLVITSVQAVNVGTYAVRVLNLFGSANSSNALLNIGPPPSILIQPTNLMVPVGAAATFSVLAGGVGPFNYQWRFNTTNLFNATNSLLMITNVGLGDAGTYVAKVSNAYGSTDTSNAVLFVGLPPSIVAQPTNQAVPLGASAAFSLVATGTAPLAYQWSFGGTNLAGATNTALVIANVQFGNVGNYSAHITNAFGSTNTSNARLTISGPAHIVIQPTSQNVPVGGMATLSVGAVGTPPLSYQWNFISGPNLPYATNSVLIVTNVQDGDKYYVRVSNGLGSDKSDNVTLHVGVPPTIVVQPTNQSVSLGSMATFSVVANGSAPLAYQWQLSGRNLANATNRVLVIANVQASNVGTYRVRISNAFSSVNSDNVTLSVGQAPLIAVQPTNQTVSLGNTTSFGVVANGAAPLSYQWSLGGTNLAGATTNVLVIGNAQFSDAGSYAVLVSNPFGSTNSSTALLVVGVPPTIVLQPTNQTAAVGQSVTLTSLASGTPPLMYQWSLNGTNLVGATNSVLLITNAQLSNAGTYAVQISNPFGSQTSSNALLSVGVPPSIVVQPTIQPTNQALLAGGVAIFSVSADGTPQLNYQWRHGGVSLTNGGRISGVYSNTLVISNVVQSDSGLYSVLVSNSWGSALSSNAALTVYVIDHFAWDPILSPKFVNVPFPVRIQTEDVTNGLVGLFNGSVALGSTGGVHVIPSSSGPFVLGSWTGSVTITQAATGLVLVADDHFGHLGYANPINVVRLPAMSVVLSGTSLLISWPAEPYFTPETSADMSSWSPLNSPIDLIGDTYQTRVPISLARAFYRLRFVPP